jgi:hypothetical protein
MGSIAADEIIVLAFVTFRCLQLFIYFFVLVLFFALGIS